MIPARFCNIISRQAFALLKPKHFSTDQQLTNVSFNNGVKKIEMCNTKTRNALSIPMMEELLENITRGQDDAGLRVIVITGIGPVFSAGHNLKELNSDGSDGDMDRHRRVFSLATELMSSVLKSPVPVIARVDGLAAAAGCQLVAQCDMAVCTENSTFSTPGASFGIFCSTPGIALGRTVSKNTAMQMLLTGQPISSQEAKEAGLVNKICNKENLDSELDKICDAIISKSRIVVAMGKRFYYEQMQHGILHAYQLGEKVMVNNVNMPDGQEGIKSFIEKRKPKWT